MRVKWPIGNGGEDESVSLPSFFLPNQTKERWLQAILKRTEFRPLFLLLEIIARTDWKGWCFFFLSRGHGGKGRCYAALHLGYPCIFHICSEHGGRGKPIK